MENIRQKLQSYYLGLFLKLTFILTIGAYNISSSWAIIHHFDDKKSLKWGRHQKFLPVGNFQFTLKSGRIYTATGVLVTPSVVLTCGHCVPSNQEEWKSAFFNVSAGGVGSTSRYQVSDSSVFMIRVHETFRKVGEEDYQGVDLALVRLVEPLTLTPAVVFDGDPLSLVDKKGYVVGYGVSGVGTQANRVRDMRKRMGIVPISAVYQRIHFIYGLIAGDVFRFHADSEIPYLGLPAQGDSGGPLFVGQGGEIQVAGIYHGVVGNAHYGIGIAGWENVYAHLDWIRQGVSELTGDHEFIRQGH